MWLPRHPRPITARRPMARRHGAPAGIAIAGTCMVRISTRTRATSRAPTAAGISADRACFSAENEGDRWTYPHLSPPAARKAAVGKVAHSVLNARAETGWPATRPRPAALKPIKASGALGDARASHGIHSGLPRSGNAAAQLNRITIETPASGINAAMAYSKANRDFSAVAASGHGDHAP